MVEIKQLGGGKSQNIQLYYVLHSYSYHHEGMLVLGLHQLMQFLTEFGYWLQQPPSAAALESGPLCLALFLFLTDYVRVKATFIVTYGEIVI